MPPAQNRPDLQGGSAKPPQNAPTPPGGLQTPPAQNRPDPQGGSAKPPQNAPTPPGGLQTPPAQNRPDPQGGSAKPPQNAPTPPGSLQMPPAQNKPGLQGGSAKPPQNAPTPPPRGCSSSDSALPRFGALSSWSCSTAVHAASALITSAANTAFMRILPVRIRNDPHGQAPLDASQRRGSAARRT